MNLTHPFSLSLDVHVQADENPFFPTGHQQARPVSGLPGWSLQPHQAQPGWLNFTLSSPELTGEDGLTELLVLLDYLAEFGPAHPDFSSIGVHLMPEALNPFQLETLGQLTGAYQRTLSGFHGTEVTARQITYQHDFRRVGLVGLPLTPNTAVTFGSVVLCLALLCYGLDTEEPDLPAPATSRHTSLLHLANVLGLDDEVRTELLLPLRRQVLVAAMWLGEISLQSVRRLKVGLSTADHPRSP